MSLKNQLTKSDYLPLDEFMKLLQGLHKDKQYIWELYARLSFCTALRASDVLSLTWADVLNKSMLIKREQKTGKVRKISFNPQTQQEITSLYKLLGTPNPAQLIFYSKYTHKPFSIQHINHIIKEWKKKYKINIGNFSTHTFRKTFGRYVYDISDNKSEALILINSILRHSNIDTTKIYIGLRDDEIQSVFNSISI